MKTRALGGACVCVRAACELFIRSWNFRSPSRHISTRDGFGVVLYVVVDLRERAYSPSVKLEGAGRGGEVGRRRRSKRKRDLIGTSLTTPYYWTRSISKSGQWRHVGQR